MRAKTPIPFTEFAPDSASTAGGQYEAKGVLSRGKKYVPLPDLQQVHPNAVIVDRCLGAWGGYATNKSTYIFAGDASRLYRFVGGVPMDVSRPSGYSVTDQDAWTFAQFGDNIIAASLGTNLLQRYQMGSSSVFADIAGSPTAGVVFRIRQHLFACNESTVNVSAFNDVTDWTPDTGTQAFQTTLASELGNIVAGLSGEQGAIICERGIVRVAFTGGVPQFAFDEVEGGPGACGPHAVAQWGRLAYIAADDGIYVYDGLQAQSIGEGRIDQYFSNNLNYPYRDKVCVAYDPGRKSVMVSYPKGGSTVANEQLIYSVTDNRWTREDIRMHHLFVLPTEGISIDDSAAVIAQFGTDNIDDIDYSIDGALWRDNRRQWAAFNDERRLCRFAGGNRAATMDTTVFEPVPSRTTTITELWPVTDAYTGVTGTLYKRQNSLGVPVMPSLPPLTVNLTAITVNSTAVTVNATVDSSDPDEIAAHAKDLAVYNSKRERSSGPAAMNGSGFCPVFGDARYVRGRIEIAAGSVWSEAMGVHADNQVSGGR